MLNKENNILPQIYVASFRAEVLNLWSINP